MMRRLVLLLLMLLMIELFAAQKTCVNKPKCVRAGGTCQIGECSGSVKSGKGCGRVNKDCKCCIPSPTTQAPLTTPAAPVAPVALTPPAPEELQHQLNELQYQLYQMDLEINRKLDHLIGCCDSITTRTSTPVPEVVEQKNMAWIVAKNTDSTTTRTSTPVTTTIPDCFVGLGRSYNGTQSKTETGIVCQRWDAQEPHEHDSNIPGEAYWPENDDNPENYCRNPDNEPGGPWCYTTNNDTRWEYCDIPVCEKTHFWVGGSDSINEVNPCPPSNVIKSGGTGYAFFYCPMSYYQAIDFCHDNGWNLATPSDDFDSFSDLMPPRVEVWLNILAKTPFGSPLVYEWQTKPNSTLVLEEQWKIGYFGKLNAPKYCTAIYRHDGLYGYKCSNEWYVACESDDFLVAPKDAVNSTFIRKVPNMRPGPPNESP